MARISLLLVTLLALAGCGSGDKQAATTTTSATQTWAAGVCSAVGTWTTAVTSATSSVAKHPDRAGLQSAADDVQQATKTLDSSLKALGKPDVAAGDQAKSAVDHLSGELSASVDKMQSAVAGANGTAAALTAVSTISSTLVTMGSDIQATVTDLKSLNGQGKDELQSAFSNAESCTALQSSTTTG
jgi:hypothetical protein